jgi:hypothetical protein
MPIPITCSRCGATRDVKDKYAGLKVQCKSCGEFVRVAGSEEVIEAELVEVEVPEVRQQPVKRRRKCAKSHGVSEVFNRLVAIVAAVGVAIVCFGLVVIGIIKCSNGNALFSDGRAPAAGKMEMTLSAIRPIQNIRVMGREAYDVDFVLSDGPLSSASYILVIRTPNGQGEVLLSAATLKTQRTVSVEELSYSGAKIKQGKVKAEAWVEMSITGKRQRVSNIISVQ